MSMFSEIGRFGTAMRRAHSDRRSHAILDRLPADIQEDIGWPIRRPEDDRILLQVILASGR